MNSHAGSLPLQPTAIAPVREWLDDLRGRLEGWGRDVRRASADEWAHLQSTVASSLATRKVEGALRTFLTRIGLGQELDSTVAELVSDLRSRVLTHRAGLTIECYQEYLVTPPRIDV
ncbi:MAG: hypothetical protein AAF581_20085 [Planctomycetota bacterium]